MAAARFYSSIAGALDLTSSISDADTTVVVSSTTGLPGTTPYTLVLDPGLATEEIVEVTNVSSTTLTVTRGVDGSSAQAHSAGVGNVRHMATARDFREPQEHIGSPSNVHGVGSGSDVVGTNTVQSLTNKTLEAASAAAVGAVVKGAADQTASYMEVRNSAGGVVVKVVPGEGTVTVGGAQVNEAGTSNLFGYVARLTSTATDVVAGVFKRKSGQTANILEVQSDAGAVLAKFDKDGKLTTPQVTSTGGVSGTTGTFSGAVSSPTITSLQSADTSLDARLDAVEAANRPKSSTAKKDKRLHWGATVVSITASTGYSADIAHGAGFTPTAVSIQFGRTTGSLYGDIVVDNIDSDSFRLRMFGLDGSAPTADVTGLPIMYFCGE